MRQPAWTASASRARRRVCSARSLLDTSSWQRGRRAPLAAAAPAARSRRPARARASSSQRPQEEQREEREQREREEAEAEQRAARKQRRSPVANAVATPAGEAQLGSFLSSRPDAAQAVQEAVDAIRGALGGDAFEPELALVFATAAYGPGLEGVVPALRQLVPSLRHVFGCTARTRFWEGGEG
jgi:hypothetical protein